MSDTHGTARYALTRVLESSYEDADRRVRDGLKREGFGVLTEIDVRATLKKKLNVDFPPYEILGACNPPLAYEALQAEPDIGVLLPCNVVVRSVKDPDRTIVEALDPVVQLEMAATPTLRALAHQVRQRLERVLDGLAAG